MTCCPHGHRDACWGDSYWHASEPLRVERRPCDEVGSRWSLMTVFSISLGFRVAFGGESGERLAESKLQSRDLIQGQGQPGAAGLYMQDQVS